MKIAFIHHTFSVGSGIDVVIYELAQKLVKNHEVTIFTFNNEYQNKFDFEIKEINIPFKYNRMINAVFSPLFLHKIVETRKELEKYEVINSHLYPSNIIPIFPKKLKNPLNIVTEWSVSTDDFSKYSEILYVNFLKKLNGYAIKNADNVITPCNFVKKWVEKEYGLETSKMFLDGVNFDLFDKNISTDSIYAKYPSLEDSKVILYVGRLSPHKNIDLLIKSFKMVKNVIPNSKLVIVGRKSFPEYSDYIEKLALNEDLKDDVLFTGVVPWDDLPKYYAICDVYATCSFWEGFLRAEAFAMKKPMVAFDVTANSETINHGENGLLVKKQDLESFAEALTILLLDNGLRRKMGDNGYKWAKENLDFDLIAKNFVDHVERMKF